MFWLALLLRVGWVGYRWVHTGSQLEFPDEQIHWQLASNLVHHGSLVTDDGRYVARMPLYPLLLTPFAAFGNAGILVARLFQALLGALTVMICIRFARAAIGPTAGLAAGIYAALDPFSIFFANLLLTETAFMPVAVGLTAGAWALAARPELRTWQAPACVALLSTAAIFVRPAALPWVVALWVLLLLMHRFRFRAIARTVIFVVVLCVALIPWGLRNRAVVGDFAWLSANGGVTLYDAQGPQADGSSNQTFLREMPELAGLEEVALDHRLELRAIDQMQRDPARVLRLAGVKFARMWNPLPNVSEYRVGLAASAGAGFTIGVLIIAAAGLFNLIRGLPNFDRERRAALLAWLTLVLLPIVAFTLLHCIFIGSVRYRVPIMPFVELLAAAVLLSKPHRADAASSAG